MASAKATENKSLPAGGRNLVVRTLLRSLEIVQWTAANPKEAARTAKATVLDAKVRIDAAATNRLVQVQSAFQETRDYVSNRCTEASGNARWAYSNPRAALYALRDSGVSLAIGVQGMLVARTVSIRNGAVQASRRAREIASDSLVLAKTKAGEANVSLRQTVADPKVQSVAAGAAGGAVALGTSGAATGLLGGGALGAALGVVPAFFTFGLALPAFSLVGAGVGLCVGTTVGGTAGLVGGGAAGYGAYTKKDAISAGAGGARETVHSGLKLVRTKTTESLAAVGTCAALARTQSQVALDSVRARIYAAAAKKDKVA